jgi:hypothetical protein
LTGDRADNHRKSAFKFNFYRSSSVQLPYSVYCSQPVLFPARLSLTQLTNICFNTTGCRLEVTLESLHSNSKNEQTQSSDASAQKNFKSLNITSFLGFYSLYLAHKLRTIRPIQIKICCQDLRALPAKPGQIFC